MSLHDRTADERGEAIRALLARPLVTRDTDESLYQLVAAHRADLARFFEEACGWKLTVDLHHGTVRLAKSRQQADATRPVVRDNGQPFDAFRYQLLWTVCAELTSRPVIAIGDLADTVRHATAVDPALTGFDPSEHRHRNAFVDTIKWLVDAGLAQVTVGDLDRYAREQRDAVVAADLSRLALLPAAATTPPSHIDAADPDEWVVALTGEVRYGDPDDPNLPADQRNLWARHQLMRRLLDDPATDTAELPPALLRYLDTPSGRQKVVELLHTAGLVLERHADVILAVDETATATDATFGERYTTVAQTAGVLLTRITGPDRTPASARFVDLVATAQDLLEGDPGWAKNYQEAGAKKLATDALDHLVAFGLARRDGDTVEARPAASRYAVAVHDARNGGTH